LLYYALTARPPFEHPQVLEILRMVSNDAPPPPSRHREGIDPRLERLVLGCLAKDPRDRPSSAAAVAETLREIQAPSPTTVRRASLAPALVAATVLVLGAAAAGALVAKGSRGDSTPSPGPTEVARVTPASPAPQPDAPADAALDAIEVELRGLIEAGDYSAAEALAREQLRAHADSSMLWRGLSVCVSYLGRLEEGLDAAVKATEVGPTDADAWSLRASHELQLERFEAALASCDRALALVPSHDQALINRGGALAAMGRNQAALADLDRAVQLKPTSLDARSNRATVRARLRDFEGALSDLDVALAESPNDGPCLQLRAGLRRQLGDGPGALEDLEALAEVVPSPELLLKLAEWRFQAGDRAGAGEAAKECLRRDETVVDAWRMVALTDGGVEAAERAMDRALELDPEHVDARCDRAALRAQQGRLQEALEDMDIALGFERDKADLFANRALIRRELGDLEASLEDWSEAARLAPEDPNYPLHSARQLLRLGRAAEALAFAERGVALAPSLAPGHAELARVLQALGRAGEAQAALRRALELDPGHPQAAEWRQRERELAE
jgi:tetratricopeptide (TPR) repeat protein